MDEKSSVSAEEIFFDALEHPAQDRGRFVVHSCAGRKDVEAEVLSLLDAHGRARGFLDRDDERRAWPGEGPERDRVPSYRLLQVLGTGGMSTVFLAERDDDVFEKTVAIKFIRRGMDSADLERRFLTERQVLANLEHPNIARLLDGGVTAEGRPYLVMEHVEGVPVDRYCEENGLGLDDRLGLFRTICSAVHFAHENLVVHRDLKPTNILVDTNGTVKLLDFGIAKVLEETEADSVGRAGASADGGADRSSGSRARRNRPVDTATLFRIMTPRYASPEQVRGEPITTRTDVYALGVLLFELLTGAEPYRVEGRTQEELAQAICDTEPSRPSAAVRRSERTIRFGKRLDGDLDNIILMALRKEPERRYASVSELSADIGRHLAGLPVLARADTLRYRASKFVRRNRAAVWLSAIAALALIGATVVSTTSYIRARQARTEAETGRRTAERINALLQEMLSSANPIVAQTRDDITVRQLLDQARGEIPSGLEEEPLVAAGLLHTIGSAYSGLAIYEEAESTYAACVELLRDSGEEMALGVALLELGRTQEKRNDLDGSERSVEEALRIFRAQEDSRAYVSECARALADIAAGRGDYELAENHLLASLAVEEQIDMEGEGRLNALNNLGVVLRRQGRFEEAVVRMEQSLPLALSIHGDGHPYVAQVLNNLGWTLVQTGKLEESERQIRSALAIYDEVYAEDHPLAVSARSNLAEVLQRTGRHEEAIAIHIQSLELFRRTLGPDHPYVAHALNNLGAGYELQEDIESALGKYAAAAGAYEMAVGREHPWFAIATYNQAGMLHRLGRENEAERFAVLALEIRRRLLDEDHPDVVRSAELVREIRKAR